MIRREKRISGIILAAGDSSRLGFPKQLILWQGKPLIRIVIDKLKELGVNPLIIVVGARKKEVMEAIKGLDVMVVDNPNWNIGISSSIKVGLSAVPEETDAILFSTCDQPFIPVELLRKIVDHYQSTNAKIVCPICEEKTRNPVLFDQSLFPELNQLQGDTGGKVLFKHHEVTTIPWDHPKDFMDIDTKNDYKKLYGKSC